MGGLITADKLGIAGAGMVQSGVNYAGGKFQQWAQKKRAISTSRAEQLRKEGKIGEARRAEFAGHMFTGMTLAAQKFKEVIPETTGGKAKETPKLILASKKAKDENWSDFKIKENLDKLRKRPNDPDYADLLAYALKEDKLDPKLAGNMLDDKRVKRGLELNQRGDLYKKLEQLDMNTTESRKAMVEGRIDDARKIIFERFKDDKIDKDFGKNIANVYKRGDAAQMKIITEMLLKISPEAIKAPLGQLKTRAQRDNFERSMDNVMESSRVGREMKATEETESLVKSYVGKIKRTTEIEMEKFKNDGNKRANIMRESDAEIEKIREHGKTSLEDIRKEIRKTFTEFDKAVPDRVKEYWPSIRKIIHSGEYKNEDVVEREELELYTKKGD
ncbi:MAG: hypothetical protein DDT40_01939 [candidate division WS2 bacterium]|nr:hypothetical protein [Candidatus Psychracetigena formicireducens]